VTGISSEAGIFVATESFATASVFVKEGGSEMSAGSGKTVVSGRTVASGAAEDFGSPAAAAAKVVAEDVN
jgi:hypothetical protein